MAGTRINEPGGGDVDTSDLPESAGSLPSRRDFDALVIAANDGDLVALAKMRDVLDENPHVWQAIGDLAKLSQLAIITAISKGNHLIAEAVQRKIDELRRD